MNDLTAGIPRRTLLANMAVISLAGASAAAKVRAGCQTRCFGQPLRSPLLDALDGIRDGGFEGFETNFVNLQPHFENPELMKDEFRKRGLELIGLHGSPKLAFRESIEAERAAGQRIARGIAALGGTHFVMSGSGVPKGADREAWVREMAAFGKFCREQGVTLSYHNHSAELADGAGLLEELIAGTNARDVSLLVDVSFFAGTPVDVLKFLERHHKRLAGIHLRNMNGKEEALLGDGQLNMPSVAATLRGVGWSGWAVLELNPRPGLSSRDMVAQSRRYMRERMHI